MSQLDGKDLNSKKIGELLEIIENENSLPKRIKAMEVAINKLLPLDSDHIQLDMLDLFIAILRHLMENILDENVDLLSSTDDTYDEAIKQTLREHLLMGIRLLKVVNILLGIITNKKTIQVSNITSMPTNVLNVVNKTFSHCKLSKNIYKTYFDSLEELLQLFKQTQHIHKKFFQVLQSNIMFNVSALEEKQILLDVIESIYDIIGVTMGMNTKSMVDTWKAFLYITGQYSEGLKNELNIGRPLKMISIECLKTLNEIDKTLTDGIQINEYLKINKFYLKIVKHIFSTYWELTKQLQVDILDFFSTIYSYYEPYLYPKTVTNEVTKIIEETYYSFIEEYLFRFVKEVDSVQIEDLVSVLHDNHFGVIILTLKIIENTQNDQSFTVSSYLSGVFQCLGPGSHNILSMSLQVYDQNLYDYLLLTFVDRLLIGSTQQEIVERILLQNLNQGNTNQSLFAHDLWILLLSKSESNLSCDLIEKFIEESELRYNKHCILGNELRTTKLKYFIRNVYNNLPEEAKEGFFDTYLPEENICLWSVIGFQNVPVSKSALADAAVECVLKKINKLEHGIIDVEEIVYMINGLAIISSTLIDEARDNMKTSLVEYVMKLWNVQFPCGEILSGTLFSNLLSELCLLTGKLISEFTGTQLAHIIKQLTIITKDATPVVKVATLQVLFPLCKSRMGRNLVSSELVRCFLNDASFVLKEFGLEMIENLLNAGSHLGILKGGSWRESLNEIKNELIVMSSAKQECKISPDILDQLRDFSFIINKILKT